MRDLTHVLPIIPGHVCPFCGEQIAIGWAIFDYKRQPVWYQVLEPQDEMYQGCFNSRCLVEVCLSFSIDRKGTR